MTVVDATDKPQKRGHMQRNLTTVVIGLVSILMFGAGNTQAAAMTRSIPASHASVVAAAPCAATTTTVRHWGGLFSSPQAQHVLIPTTVNLPEPVCQVGTSNSDYYMLLDDGTVWAMGYNDEGQLGIGTNSSGFTATPVQVQFPAGVLIARLSTDAMPFDAAMAIDTNGNVWAWGDAQTGVECMGKGTMYTTPVKLPFSNVSLVAGASAHAIFDVNGVLYACGANQYGATGTGKTGPSFTPALVAGNLQNVVALYASSVNSGALLSNGSFYEWGDNDVDQLCDGKSGGSSNVPVLVPLPGVAQAAMGGDLTTNGSSLFQLTNGNLYACGDDQYGELGDGKTTNEPSPVPFSSPVGVTYSTLAAGGLTGYAITTTGAVEAWGYGKTGQLGNNTTTTTQLTPVTSISSGVTGISSTALGVLVTP